jgi:ligand-binding sensor domain-containing protein
VRSLLLSATGDLWIATDSPSRLQRLHEGELHRQDLAPRIGSIRAMAEDAAGNIFVGTTEGQLFRINGDLVVNEADTAPAGPLSIRCLCATSDGALWIGYAGQGLGGGQGSP